jgi:oligoendopeptidase F
LLANSPARFEISVETPRWSLSDLLPAKNGELFSLFLRNMESELVEFESAKQTLGNSISKDEFQSLLEGYERIARMRSRLTGYAYLYFSEDTRVQDSRTFKDRAEEIDTDAENRTLFFETWWKKLDLKKANELLASSGSFAYYLDHLRRAIPHTLDEPVEKAINLKDSTGKSKLVQLYHQIRESFAYELTIDGKKQVVNEERLRDLFYSPNRIERELAYDSLLSKFKQNTDVLGEIYKAIAKDWSNEALKLRNYATPISVRNFSNDVSDEAVDVLLDVCKEKSHVFQDFFRVKAKILGIEHFDRFDIYAAAPKVDEKEYSWNECVKLVLKTFDSFSTEFSEKATKVFESNHIDAEGRGGKMAGAYCLSPDLDVVPYILISYTPKARSVSTIAHELGHAVHSQLAAARTANALTYEASLPLAETASTFAEMLLMDRLIEDATPDGRRSLILTQLEDCYANIQRQANFVLFEIAAHRLINDGVNVDDLSELYLRNLRDQFSESVYVPDIFRYEWSAIPHIYQSPFYCYSYAWGNLLVLSLYKQYKKEPRDFTQRYLKILSYGGSMEPKKILSDAGFDVESRSFWREGYDYLSSLVSLLGNAS